MKRLILLKIAIAVPFFVAGFMAGIILAGQSVYLASDISLLVSALVIGIFNLVFSSSNERKEGEKENN